MWFRPAYPPKGPGPGLVPDLEAGPNGVARPLYPAMIERPELRWAFIRKVYLIVSLQMLLTVAVGAAVVYYRPIAYFFVSGGAGLGLYILTLFMPFIAVIFCGYIIYDTDNLIKRYTYDDYVWAAVALYLDIINLFLALLTIFRANEP